MGWCCQYENEFMDTIGTKVMGWVPCTAVVITIYRPANFMETTGLYVHCTLDLGFTRLGKRWSIYGHKLMMWVPCTAVVITIYKTIDLHGNYYAQAIGTSYLITEAMSMYSPAAWRTWCLRRWCWRWGLTRTWPPAPRSPAELKPGLYAHNCTLYQGKVNLSIAVKQLNQILLHKQNR